MDDQWVFTSRGEAERHVRNQGGCYAPSECDGTWFYLWAANTKALRLALAARNTLKGD